MKTKIFYLSIVVVFVSCKKYNSADVAQDTIKQYYTVTYNKASNQTIVQAQFQKGLLNSVLLQSPSTVLYNSATLQYSGYTKSYQAVFNGDATNGQFRYTNNTGLTYTNNTQQIANIGFIGAANMYVNKAYPFTIGLGYNQFGNDGSNLYFSFANKKFYSQYSNNGYIIDISTNELQNITSGFYLGNFIREKTERLQQSSGAGGQITIENISDNYSIQIY